MTAGSDGQTGLLNLRNEPEHATPNVRYGLGAQVHSITHSLEQLGKIASVESFLKQVLEYGGSMQAIMLEFVGDPCV